MEERKHLQVLSIEMDLVESGKNWQAFIKKGEAHRFSANAAQPPSHGGISKIPRHLGRLVVGN